MRAPPAAVAVGFLLVPFAGCVVGGDFEALGTVERAMVGWAYDGEGVASASGEWFVRLDPSADDGEVRLSASVEGRWWEVTMAEFQSSNPFQQGGVRCNYRGHGATLNGGPEIPEIAVHCAAWGFARATRDNETVEDPATGEERLAARVMVTRDGVRGPDGRISSRGGSRVYDPTLPSDGRTFPGQEEFYLLLVKGDGAETVWFHFEGRVTKVRDAA